MSLPSRECGLKWQIQKYEYGEYDSHSLRGSVDCNCLYFFHSAACKVTPFAGVWIEIRGKLQKRNKI